MKLYPKTINSVNDLEREKRKLLKKKRDLDKESFLSMDGIMGKDKKDEKGSKVSWLDLLPLSSPVAAFVLDIIGKRMRRRRPEPVYYDHKGNAKKPEGSKAKKMAFEFIGGYLKWKALELSIKGVQHLMKQRKEKRQAKTQAREENVW